jgi:hypothetical protein
MEYLQLADELTGVIQKLTTILTVAGVIVALLQCYLGYRLLRFWVSLIGGIIGFALGFGLSRVYLTQLPGWAPFVIGGVAAALLGFLAFRLYLVGVFLFCGFLGGSIIMLLSFPKEQVWHIVQIVLTAAVFLIVGVLAVKFNRHVVILMTAAAGGMHAARGITKLYAPISQGNLYRYVLAAALILSGILIQFLTTRRYARRKR